MPERIRQAGSREVANKFTRGLLLRGSFCAGFFLRLALLHDGRSKFGSEILRKGVELGVAVNLDCLFGCSANHVAVMSLRQMLVEFGLGRSVNDAVQIIGQLVKEFRALHWLPSPLPGFGDPFDFSRL